MQVYNWIQAEFSQGPDFVSDAPDVLASEIGRLIRDLPRVGSGIEFGRSSLDGSTLSVIHLRKLTARGTLFSHAVACLSTANATTEAIERAFVEKYGQPVERRIDELCHALSGLDVARATMTLTDLFLERGQIASLRSGTASARPTLRSRSAPVGWALAALSLGIAGFVVGRLHATTLPRVDAAPPGFQERVRTLPTDLGPAGMSLSAQLEHERRLHAGHLEDMHALIASLTSRLADAEALEVDEEPPGHQLAQDALAEETPLAEASVLADVLWVREGPGTEHRRIRHLQGGDPVKLEGSTKGEWTRIAEPTPGWVATRFIAKTR